MNKSLFLASSSPYRRELLERLKLPFEAISPNVDESPLDGEGPKALALRLSLVKARAIASQVKSGLVIGSDQVGAVDGRIYGKPKDRGDAIEQLTSASGKTMTLFTGLAMINAVSGAEQSDVVCYTVRYRALTPTQIERYVDTEEPYGCCGSLKSEGLGIALLAELSGDDPTALIGLPLIRLTDMLAQEGYLPLA